MANIRQISRAQSPVPLAPEQRLAVLQDWIRSKESFTASYRFESTSTALEFITLVGLLAEKVGVHPHVEWRIDVVSLRLGHGPSTEMTGDDVNLARRISAEAHRLDGAALINCESREAIA